ncbi:uncharacterized protein LY89DRAFT_778835 [Mollisia scopiformis]|uniref:Uncharacterized protein n=1 Tax=Mollisia scopiformis TaxID=149040 RepID=A0A194XM76_MOLSC|nr:uncharacterized protein LY89DRAFT_778835 [Mollisia scopiformis]KUJ21241.1 hypothetical protein LY89DRAFT_778835 [Mollisia scopiformis]
MLGVAREKARVEGVGVDGEEVVRFLEGDVGALEGLEGLELGNGEGEEEEEEEEKFDVITICSALVLLDRPGEAMKGWVERWLKRGGRLVCDVPCPRAMLGIKTLARVGKMVGVETLGDWEWVEGAESLRKMMEGAGLDARVIETEAWEEVPSRTKFLGRMGEEGVWGVEEGGDVFDDLTRGREKWRERREEARGLFEVEWRGMGGEDGLVREVNGLFVGIGVKR